MSLPDCDCPDHKRVKGWLTYAEIRERYSDEIAALAVDKAMRLENWLTYKGQRHVVRYDREAMTYSEEDVFLLVLADAENRLGEPSFRGTVTGRLSVNGPAIQNIRRFYMHKP